MSPADLNRAAARATGEPIDRVRQRGFSLLRLRSAPGRADAAPTASPAPSDSPSAAAQDVPPNPSCREAS